MVVFLFLKTGTRLKRGSLVTVWRCVLGFLLLGEVLLLGGLLGGPFWLVEVALMSSSVKSYVSFGVLN